MGEALKRFAVRKKDGESWNYVVEVEGAMGAVARLDATFDDLDGMAAILDHHLDAIVEAAAKKALGIEAGDSKE